MPESAPAAASASLHLSDSRFEFTPGLNRFNKNFNDNSPPASRDIFYYPRSRTKPKIPACHKDAWRESIFPARPALTSVFSKPSGLLRQIQFFPATGNAIRFSESD